MTDLFNLVQHSDWNKIIDTYSVDKIAAYLAFKEGITLDYRMLNNEDWNEEI